jgi:PKHD-type hydroxylase
MLLHVPKVLNAEELQLVRQQLAGAPWADGRETAGSQSAQVKHNQQLPSRSDPAPALQSMILAALDRQATFFSATLPRRVLPPLFNRYAGAANRYGNHVDQAIRYVPDSGQRVRTDISCTLFLSAPDAYDGGELVIEHDFGTQRVKLAAGDLLLYPGTSVHRVEPVTRGERLASFFWVESMVRSAEQRRLLFEMDQSLVSLRQAHGESPETTRLTGCYHNLLRLWADS